MPGNGYPVDTQDWFTLQNGAGQIDFADVVLEAYQYNECKGLLKNHRIIVLKTKTYFMSLEYSKDSTVIINAAESVAKLLEGRVNCKVRKHYWTGLEKVPFTVKHFMSFARRFATEKKFNRFTHNNKTFVNFIWESIDETFFKYRLRFILEPSLIWNPREISVQ